MDATSRSCCSCAGVVDGALESQKGGDGNAFVCPGLDEVDYDHVQNDDAEKKVSEGAHGQFVKIVSVPRIALNTRARRRMK